MNPSAIFRMRKFPSFLTRGDVILNSEAMERQFWSADVYDSSPISLNRDRIPDSMVRNDKLTLGKEKEHVEKVKERRLVQN